MGGGKGRGAAMICQPGRGVPDAPFSRVFFFVPFKHTHFVRTHGRVLACVWSPGRSEPQQGRPCLASLLRSTKRCPEKSDRTVKLILRPWDPPPLLQQPRATPLNASTAPEGRRLVYRTVRSSVESSISRLRPDPIPVPMVLSCCWTY